MSSAHDRSVLNHILNPLMPTDVAAGDAKIEDDEPIDHDGYSESTKLEKEGIVQAERGDVEASIATFTKAIALCPISPSVYNNRAQSLRLKGKEEDARLDLDKAIEVSKGRGRSGCNAFVQRAMIRRLQGDDDGAREDFQKACDLGSSFAKMQLVALNPYAAMCNKMLAEVIGQLRTPQEEKK